MASPTDLPVVIVGAGISGLALAQALLRRHIPFRLYERDALFDERLQGYRVQISKAGIEALKNCLTPDLYTQLESSCAQFTSKDTGPLWQFDALSAQQSQRRFAPPPPESGAPTVTGEVVEPLNADRSVLRNVLMQGLQSHVEFGKDFVAYEIMPARVTVRFRDGSSVEGRLLVGADGASSRVRRQLIPGYQHVDTEGRFIYGKTVLTKELEQKFHEKCLQGLSLVQDTTKETPTTLLLEPVRFKDNQFRSSLPEDYVYWVIMAHKDRHNMDDKQLLSLSNEEVAAQARSMTAHWHSSFHALFDLQKNTQTSMIRIVSAQTDIPGWQSSTKVTLVGDAAHVMSPTAGVGATTALRDAVKLSEVLAGGDSQDKSISDYEEAMRIWASNGIIRSRAIGQFAFGMPPFNEMKYIDA